MKHHSFLPTCICAFALIAAPKATGQWIQAGGPAGGFSGTIGCYAVDGPNLFAGTGASGSGGGVYLTTNNGTSWNAVNNGLPGFAVIYDLAVQGTNLFAGTDASSRSCGVYLSTNKGTSWTGLKAGFSGVTAFAVIDSHFFVANFDSVYLTTNVGASWTTINTGVGAHYVKTFVVIGTVLFGGTEGKGVVRSTDFGASWEEVDTGMTDNNVLSFAVSGTTLFAGTGAGGVCRSTDFGANWTPVNAGLPGSGVFALTASGGRIFAGLGGDGVFFSTDNGTSWNDANDGLTSRTVYALVASGADLFAGTYDGGSFKRPLSEFNTSRVDAAPQVPRSASSHPNPIHESATIHLSSSDRTRVDIRIVNLLGADVARIFSGQVDPGDRAFTWDAHNVPPGMYACVIQSRNYSTQIPILMVK